MTMQARRRPLLADVVRTELRQAIVDGEFQLGSKLPNEEQLGDRFRVSRITIREAVRGLIEDGLVVRRQGSGTFVTRRPTLHNTLDTNFSYTEYIKASGVKAGMRVLGVETVPADAETAAALDLPLRTPVVEVRRVRTADGSPAIYSVEYLPEDIVGADRGTKRFEGSLYRLLTVLGHPIDHGEATLTPVVADRSLAELLELPKRSPLQHVRQVDFDTDGRPVLLSLEWHVPSVIELHVYRRGPGPLDGSPQSTDETV